MTIDIILLPVRNQTLSVLQTYDQLNKQRQELMTVTILDNHSVDGLTHRDVHDIDFYAKSTRPLKNTSSFLHSAINHQRYDPNDYILLLAPGTILPDNYIENLTDFIYEGTDYVIDVVLGAVNFQKARSTTIIGDPRTKKHEKRVEADKKRLLAQTVATNTTNEEIPDSTTFTKKFGKPERDPEKETKPVFESREVITPEKHKKNIELLGKLQKIVKTPHGTLHLEEPTKEAMEWATKVVLEKEGKLKTNWSGIDLNLAENYRFDDKVAINAKFDEKSTIKTNSVEKMTIKMDSEEKLTEKKDSIENQSASVSPGLMTPISEKSISRSEKYSVKKDTQTEKSVKKDTIFDWKRDFIPNNVLFRRHVLLNSDAYDTKQPFVNWLCQILHNIDKVTRIEIQFSPEWPVISKTKKLIDVDKIVRSVNKDTVIEGAKTERESKKESEQMGDRIIPDPSTLDTIASTRPVISMPTHPDINVVSGHVQQYVPEIKDTNGKKVSGPAWYSWME
jgi:hypothetical protein